MTPLQNVKYKLQQLTKGQNKFYNGKLFIATKEYISIKRELCIEHGICQTCLRRPAIPKRRVCERCKRKNNKNLAHRTRLKKEKKVEDKVKESFERVKSNVASVLE